jgi:hypothetical protein
MKPFPKFSTARTTALIVSVAGLALAMLACDAGASSTASVASANSQLVAFTRCVRSHGVPNFPDPQPGASNAKFPSAQQLGVSSAKLSAAEKDCQRLLPPGTDDQFPSSEVPLLLRGMVRFSRCMRQHGVPNWPDPITDSQGRPVFDLGRAGITRSEFHSLRITRAEQKCEHLLPSQLGGVPVGGS